MIELSLDSMAVDADVPSEDLIAQGTPAIVHVQVIGGNELPLADPQHPGRPLRTPAIAVNFGLTRSTALQFAELIRKKAESLPEDSASSKLAVVKDLSEAGKVLEFDRVLRGKNNK